jgi:hypothetical protein
MTCENCSITIDHVGLCSACAYLSSYGTFEDQQRADRARQERLTNRRWQMRFNLGLLP